MSVAQPSVWFSLTHQARWMLVKLKQHFGLPHNSRDKLCIFRERVKRRLLQGHQELGDESVRLVYQLSHLRSTCVDLSDFLEAGQDVLRKFSHN